MTPPLPNPTAYTCPQCGFGWNEGERICPRCGATWSPVARERGRGTSCARLFYLSSLMICGILGLTFLFFGLTPGGGPYFLIGLVFLASTVVFVGKFISS